MTLPNDHDLLLAALRFQGGAHSPTLLPGQHPQAALALLPPLAGLLGSVETPAQGEGYAASLYFVPLPAAATDQFIREANAALQALGWREAERRPGPFRPSGFQDSRWPVLPEPTSAPAAARPDPCMTLLHDAAKVAACWNMRVVEEGSAFLCFNLQPHAYRHWARQEDDILPILPPLGAPQGYMLEIIGGGGSGNQRASHAQSLALLRGAGQQQALYAHFAGQLNEVGWAEQSVAATPTLTTSSWHTPENELGVLTLVQRGPGLWQAGLEVTRLSPSRQEGTGESWFSF